MKTTTIAKLRVGQRFSWIPSQWYGAAKLISKKRQTKHTWDWEKKDFKKNYVYDLKFDAAVVNPPAIQYWVPGNTKVRLLKRANARLRRNR